MKNWLLSLLVIIASPLFAQQAVYQGFETDTAAEPRGGMAYLGTFLQANLDKPTAAAARGLGGRVIVKGVVETNGQISDVSVVQSLHPDLDREAVRVFSRFHAWRPAHKGGQAVRQFVSIPVMFKPNAPFTYANGIRTDYFGADRKPVTDSTQAQFKKSAPIDERGLPTGDLIIYERKRSAWKEINRLPLARRDDSQRGPSGQPLYLIGHQDADKLWQDMVYSVDDTGAIFRRAAYENGLSPGPDVTYHANGIVAQNRTEYETRYVLNAWYANGQIKRIWTTDRSTSMTAETPEQVTLVWDSTGHQYVKDGNGRAIYTAMMQSYRDTTQRTQYREEGPYAGGLKQGVWTGRYADGSYFYQEQYDKGICQGGKAITAGQDTIRYTVLQQQPEFTGGMPGLSQFLAQNLRYPASAQKAGVQGRVFVRFVVCQDGALCDYEVLKGVHPDVDQEAVRVVKAMSGRWKPGVQRGQKVRVKYNLPINFALQ